MASKLRPKSPYPPSEIYEDYDPCGSNEDITDKDLAVLLKEEANKLRQLKQCSETNENKLAEATKGMRLDDLKLNDMKFKDGRYGYGRKHGYDGQLTPGYTNDEDMLGKERYGSEDGEGFGGKKYDRKRICKKVIKNPFFTNRLKFSSDLPPQPPTPPLQKLPPVQDPDAPRPICRKPCRKKKKDGEDDEKRRKDGYLDKDMYGFKLDETGGKGGRRDGYKDRQGDDYDKLDGDNYRLESDLDKLEAGRIKSEYGRDRYGDDYLGKSSDGYKSDDKFKQGYDQENDSSRYPFDGSKNLLDGSKDPLDSTKYPLDGSRYGEDGFEQSRTFPFSSDNLGSDGIKKELQDGLEGEGFGLGQDGEGGLTEDGSSMYRKKKKKDGKKSCKKKEKIFCKKKESEISISLLPPQIPCLQRDLPPTSPKDIPEAERQLLMASGIDPDRKCVKRKLKCKDKKKTVNKE